MTLVERGIFNGMFHQDAVFIRAGINRSLTF